VALGAQRILGADKRRRCFVGACVVILLMSLSARTILRNKDWRSEEELYRSGVAVNPPKGKESIHSMQ